MATIGELNDLAVSDLIEIFTRRGRTGRLVVKTGGQEVQLFFEEGRISLVSSTDVTIRLGRILIRQGLLDTPRLLEALHAQAESENPKPIGVILIERGWITREDLTRCVEEQSIEALARAVTDEPGFFVFDSGLTKPSSVESVPLDPLLLLKAAKERIDAMHTLKAQLPHPETQLILCHYGEEFNRSMTDLGVPESMIAGVLRSGPKSFGEMGFLVALDEFTIGIAVLTLIELGIVATGISGGNHRPTGRDTAA